VIPSLETSAAEACHDGLADGRSAFIYPPKFSLYIADPRRVAELGFILLLAVTASKAVGVLTEPRSPSWILSKRERVAVETAWKVDEKLKKAIEIARTMAWFSGLPAPTMRWKPIAARIGSDRAEPSELEADIERLDQALGKF